MNEKLTPTDAFKEVKRLLMDRFVDFVSEIRGPLLESLTTHFNDMSEFGRPSRMVQRRLVTISFVWTDEV